MSAKAAAFHSAWSPATVGRRQCRRISAVPPYMSNNCRNIVTLNIHRYTFISIFMDSIGYCVIKIQ